MLDDYLPLNAIDCVKLSSIYDICMNLSNMRMILDWFEDEASKSSPGEVRPMILALKRSTRDLADVIQPAFSSLSLLRYTFDELQKWFVARGYMNAEDEVIFICYRQLLISKDFRILGDLIQLWLHMAFLLNEEDSDPSYYSLFRDALELWLARSKGTTLFEFGNHIRSSVRNLSGSIDLSTGMTMTAIWEAERPIVPSTLQQWDTYQKFMSVISEFEKKVLFRIGISPFLVA